MSRLISYFHNKSINICHQINYFILNNMQMLNNVIYSSVVLGVELNEQCLNYI